jgi:hypothetical protein
LDGFDIKNAADQLSVLLRDKDLRIKMGKAARQKAMAISEIPPANPSRPSIILIAFVMPTIHITLITISIGKNIGLSIPFAVSGGKNAKRFSG